MSISKSDNGKEIAFSRGDIVEVSLESGGATGYLWDFSELDPTFVEVLREETSGKSAGGMTGGPVTHKWTLRLIKEGLTDIRMTYFRPWEGKDKAADTFRVRLRILP